MAESVNPKYWVILQSTAVNEERDFVDMVYHPTDLDFIDHGTE